jgi:hypothetical protein
VTVRALIAIALLLSITPGMSEVIEVGVHLVAHADLPHHESEPDRGCSEHACTPLAHHCGCHATMSAQACSRATNAATSRGMTRLDPAAIAAILGCVSEPPPLRPPIA